MSSLTCAAAQEEMGQIICVNICCLFTPAETFLSATACVDYSCLSCLRRPLVRNCFYSSADLKIEQTFLHELTKKHKKSFLKSLLLLLRWSCTCEIHIESSQTKGCFSIFCSDAIRSLKHLSILLAE